MKITKITKLAAAIAAASALAGCLDSDSDSNQAASSVVDCSTGRTIDIAANVQAASAEGDTNNANVSSQLSSALNNAKTCDTIVLPEGKHTISSSLSFSGTGSLGQSDMVTNLTIKGAGMPKDSSEASPADSGLTALDFTGTSGDGFLIQNTQSITMQDFGVFEAANNAIKLKDTDGIILRKIATVWETDFQDTNGAYGLYPVETSNVLIEDSYVRGSADAGVYVGQSDNVVVRRNEAFRNVAGIEIENTTDADVYDNIARENTGGILVFDLPIGNGKYGSGVRVFNNIIDDNNTTNFAKPSSNPGGVHIVPPGTGVIILSTSDVEIYNNEVTDHQTTSIAITSFMMPDASVATPPDQGVGTTVLSYGDIQPYADVYLDGWNPMVRGINIHDNTISVAQGINAPEGSLIQDIIDGMGQAQHALEMIDLANGDKPQLPHILYDGVGELMSNAPSGNAANPSESIFEAIVNGVNQIASAVFLNIVAPADSTATLSQVSDVTEKFGMYSDTGADRVCQSNNGVGQGVYASAVFDTTPSADNVSGSGEPFSKLELFEAAAGANDMPTAGAIGATLLADSTMTCDGFEAFQGSAAVVTVNGESFGCGADDASDSSSASCAL